ncbi:MAG: glycosyltransferase, partial [Xanthobacteraceae bacterium]
MTTDLLASMVLAIWLYLLLARGAFWLGRERNDAIGGQGPWPAITAVIPARDEAECVGETVVSLLRQDYAGEFHVVLVDDQSRDGTAEVARAAAAALGAIGRLTVLSGRALPTGWTGKLWAQSQGVEAAEAAPRPPELILLTDADIVYAPGE